MYLRLFSLVLMAIAITSCSTLKNNIQFAKNPVVAHRGAWKTTGLPENSIASLKQAIKLGFHGSEFDVRITTDDSLIVNHDPHYNKFQIEKTTYAELEKFKLANGEKLPTLREYILAGITNNKQTQLVCEIKPSDMGKARAEEIVKKVLALFKELKAEQYVTYISFDYNMLKTIHRLAPKATTQYLNGNKSPDTIKIDGLTGIDYHFDAFKKNPQWITEANKLGITLNAWTINDDQMLDFYIAKDFNFITTNEPENLLERYKKSKKTKSFNKLVWEDNFNGKTLDTTKWNYAIGNGKDGWGNQEKQYYTNRPQNIEVKDGILKIKAVKENFEGYSFTSARINTLNKLNITYGKIEVKARLASGGGAWPAIWMLGQNMSIVGWPLCGEIDIMENVGNDGDRIHSTLHYPNHFGAKGVTNSILTKNADKEFRVYALEWTEDYIKTYIDNQLIGYFTNTSEMPFHKDQYLLLNLAIGGNFGGKVDPSLEKTIFEIDYVKVYQ